MNVNNFSREYGTALYNLAVEENTSETVFNEFSELAKLFEASPDFIRYVSIPSFPKSERVDLVGKVFEGKIDRSLLNFLKLLSEKRRMASVGKCYEVYKELYCADNGILPVKAYSAVALSDQQKKRLSEQLERKTGRKVLLEAFTDPSCIGGIRLEYDGKRYDASVRGKLSGLLGAIKTPELQKSGDDR